MEKRGAEIVVESGVLDDVDESAVEGVGEGFSISDVSTSEAHAELIAKTPKTMKNIKM